MSPIEKLCFGDLSSVLLICAHPDDEVIGAGAQLPRWRQVSIIYVTDGAPRNEQDAMTAGFRNRTEYAQARRRERANALRIMNERRSVPGSGIDVVDFGFADQEAAFHIPEIAHTLAAWMDRATPEFVVTHAYEGGHPDHDSTALAVSAACSILRNHGHNPPVHVEMTSYHGCKGQMTAGEFLPSGANGVISIPLTLVEREFKARLFGAYASQARVLQYFQIEHEDFRVAPAYDFSSAPHPGPLWYDRFNWGVTSSHWRHLAKIALANLNIKASLRPGVAPGASGHYDPYWRKSPGGRDAPLYGRRDARRHMVVIPFSMVPRLTILNVAYPMAAVSRDAVGGAEQVLAQLDAAVVEAGHRSIVVAREDSIVFGELIPTPLWDGALNAQSKRAANAHSDAIRRAQRQWHIDVIHLHGIDFPQYIQACESTTLVTLHLPIEWYPPEIFQSAGPHIRYNCVSSSQRKACPPCAQLIPPIQNGVALEQFHHRHAKRNFALCLGRICPEKGFHIAIDAAKRAAIPLLLAGKVYNYPAHERYYRSEIIPRLDQSRRFIGVADLRRKRRLLSAARCLLVPSLAPETSSLVAMEALACGTPVVAFPSGALTEIVEHGQTGFLVRNETEIAEAIHECRKIDPDRCRHAARRRFDLRKTIHAYLNLYAALAGTAERAKPACKVLDLQPSI